MISPQRLLVAVRADLAHRVLPALDDDRARSSVIAAMGILKELAGQVRPDESWIADSLASLESAAAQWRARLDHERAALLEPATLLPAARRETLLAGIEQLIDYLWRTGDHAGLLPEIREVLRADAELEGKRLD
ncbi:hypothetical protein [Candidatus Protofrankia californiensis]|uniref:hypothetical protein n=1 Tax=Candidatus Protofrankia californiensis TaxID=1839754 RepID=UPI001041093A|nr:hypothetical protein [Candidatus Protofrankia californiensis]